MNPDEIKRIVDELDRGISQENANVSIQMYGPDLDEAFIVATERGYLRLGVEFLKAGFAPYLVAEKIRNRPHAINVELDYLLTEDSVHFDYFERSEDIKIETYQASWVDRVIPIALLGAIILVIGLAIVGFLFISRTMRQTFLPILFVALTIHPCVLATQAKALTLDQVSAQVEGYIQESRGWNHETALPPTPPGAQPSRDVSIHFWSSEKCLTASLIIDRKSYGLQPVPCRVKLAIDQSSSAISARDRLGNFVMNEREHKPVPFPVGDKGYIWGGSIVFIKGRFTFWLSGTVDLNIGDFSIQREFMEKLARDIAAAVTAS
jgi:hypothetical protein